MTKARDISKLLSTANGKIAGENLDVSFENITDTGTEGTRVATGTSAQRGTTAGQLRFNSDTGLAEYYDGSTFKAIDVPPEINSISPSSIDESDLGSSQTIVITGNNFSSNATVSIIGLDSTVYNPVSTTIDSSSQITITTPTNLVSNNEPYDIKVTNISGLSVTGSSLLSINDLPVFAVASGSLGTLADSDRSASNLTSVTATDEENDAITFSQTAGTLPTGITFNSNGTWSGTANSETSDTPYNFTITATSGGQTATRNYSITVSAPRIVEYLVIAGGGGGGVYWGGGGGAGGYRNSYSSETSGGGGSSESSLILNGGITYTITVGAGGLGNQPGDGDGNVGNNSSISGADIATITSNGGGFGGGGAGLSRNGGAGGSGGGAGGSSGASGGSGTANQGYNGGSHGGHGSWGAGGGAGSAGSGSSSGSGLSSSITGSAVTRAQGGYSSVSSANTGGGGTRDGGNGQSGVVILRMLDGVYSGITTGSPTVTTGVDGTDTVLVFNASGSYTA
jgi:hypothetical protein